MLTIRLCNVLLAYQRMWLAQQPQCENLFGAEPHFVNHAFVQLAIRISTHVVSMTPLLWKCAQNRHPHVANHIVVQCVVKLSKHVVTIGLLSQRDLLTSFH